MISDEEFTAARRSHTLSNAAKHNGAARPCWADADDVDTENDNSASCTLPVVTGCDATADLTDHVFINDPWANASSKTAMRPGAEEFILEAKPRPWQRTPRANDAGANLLASLEQRVMSNATIPKFVGELERVRVAHAISMAATTRVLVTTNQTTTSHLARLSLR